MQADLDLSEAEMCIKECVVDGCHAHFVIITKDAVVRLLMNVDLMERVHNLIRLILPEGCKSIDNISNLWPIRPKIDMTLRAVDVRVGGPSQYRGPAKPELRLYTGKKKKHAVHMNLSWGQLALLQDLIAGLQKYVTPSAVA